MSRNRLVAIASGKGGVGKSFFSANISSLLAASGRLKVLLIDFDLGAANIHTYLRVKKTKKGLSDFFSKRVFRIEDTIAETEVPRLDIISGANDDLDIQGMSEAALNNFFLQLYPLPYDYIVLDLGAGTHNIFIDAFNKADLSFVLSAPERTSIENARRFVKSAFFRRFFLAEKRGLGLGSALRNLKIHQCDGGKLQNYSELLQLITKSSPVMGPKIEDELATMFVRFVLNMVHSEEEVWRAQSMVQECKDAFGVDACFAGHLSYDPACRTALERGVPFVLDNPSSVITHQLCAIAESIVGRTIVSEFQDSKNAS